ncbi:S-formylglutathione hydrolase-like [Brevipalpus obovatus]|uniref:S-formylglutathione hydrolase-like n=1 Tax=Brevipalpus obovatus TaxID=246614 RepID=UPI003D9EEFFB
MSSLKLISSSKCFGGYQKVFNHFSEELQSRMNFTLYQPPLASETKKVPVIYWLAGLFADEQTFIQRGGFQRYASELNLCVVGPDTGPRECKIDDDPDLGPGATYYLDAVTEKWKKNYRMHSYITKELIQVVEKNFPFVQPDVRAISGHSMGGHGALICSFRNPGLYKVATALAPICNPTETKLARKVCPAYLGSDYEEIRKEWDSTYLVKKYKGPPLHVLIDQGSKDHIKDEYLRPKRFIQACAEAGFPLIYREQEGYDHELYFVATFIEDHFKHISNFLK